MTDQSLNRLGLLDGVKESLKRAGMDWVIYEGVTPDPVSASVDEAVSILKAEKCDAVIGVGGGSVMDATKIMAMMATNEGDLWDYVQGGTGKGKTPANAPLPNVCITTTAGTGSEADAWGVVTNEQTKEKIISAAPYR